MKKILGLDIGSNSIGWALVHEPEADDNQKYHIADMGVRIIPLSTDENDEFTKGNAISKNAKRTAMRGARRNLQRYKLRRQQLQQVLKALGMMPDAGLFELNALALYGLRARGITGQLTLAELGRVLYHLNQKRGYKSNRKANNDDEQPAEQSADDTRVKKKGYLDLINDREQALKDQGITIGQHFYAQLLEQDNSPGSPPVRIKENIYLRSTYMDEFDRIWSAQQKYYPDVLTDGNRDKIRNEIIYYQRPLRSQKGLVSNCLFEKHHKAAPKSSPLFQVAKIWQELNNIELSSFKALRGIEDGFDKQGKRKLTPEEKERLFALLNIKGKLTTRDCLKELGYKSEFDDYKLNIRNEKELEGNRTYAQLRKVFDHFKVDADALLKFDITELSEKVDQQTGEITTIRQIKAGFEKEPLYQLWHLLYSIEDPATLINTLQSKYSFTVDMTKALARIDFTKQGYGSLSARALRKILPFLQQGHNYAEACKLAGYNHSASLTSEQNAARLLVDKLELYPKNSLRQPVVEKIINQVINLVNAIIDEGNGYVTKEERHNGKFEIRVELARSLKQNAEERNKTYARNSRQDRRHKEIEAIIKNHLPHRKVSRNDIVRYKLWEEFGQISPYEPEKPIPLAQLFSNEYDIEHIIPKSRLFDDSYNNKTICRRSLNSGTLGKNQMTAHDFMKSQGEQAFRNYLEFIKLHLNKKDGISKAKYDKLMLPVDKIPEDFINRQLQETRFISREIKSLLTQVCINVHATSGAVTDYLRHHWGYDRILQDLNWHKYEAIGKAVTETSNSGKKLKKILDWSKRDDHRHHAVDALVIACTKQVYIQQLNKLNQTVEKRGQQSGQDALKEINIKTQEPFSFQEVSAAVSQILVSFKPGKKVASSSINKLKKSDNITSLVKTLAPRGFLHKETVYGRIKQFEEVKLSPKFNRLDDVVQPGIKALLIQHLTKFNNDAKAAFNTKNLLNFKEQHGFDSVTVYGHEHVVKYRLDTNFKLADAEYIVDKGIKAAVLSHLAQHGNNPKVAFNIENPVWMNKEKGIQIKSVRCFTNLYDLQPLHQNEYGEPVDFVTTRNNHHMAIYRDENDKLKDITVSLWEAVKRKKAQIQVVIHDVDQMWDQVLNADINDEELLTGLPQPKWQFVTALQQNEMFVFGLTAEDLKMALANNDRKLISDNLYRVQKMSKKSSGAIDVWFRHHLETKLDDSLLAKETKKFINVQSLSGLTGNKVKIDNIGRIFMARA